jgi:GNAT superfamily N-acetyltransferase
MNRPGKAAAATLKALGSATVQVVKSGVRAGAAVVRRPLPITLEAAGVADALGLWQLMTACGTAPAQREGGVSRVTTAIAQVLAAGAQVWVARRGEQVVGVLTLYLLPSLGGADAPAAWVDDLTVWPGGAGSGAGRALMNLAAEQARQAGAQRLGYAPRRQLPGRFFERLQSVKPARHAPRVSIR